MCVYTVASSHDAAGQRHVTYDENEVGVIVYAASGMMSISGRAACWRSSRHFTLSFLTNIHYRHIIPFCILHHCASQANMKEEAWHTRLEHNRARTGGPVTPTSLCLVCSPVWSCPFWRLCFHHGRGILITAFVSRISFHPPCFSSTTSHLLPVTPSLNGFVEVASSSTSLFMLVVWMDAGWHSLLNPPQPLLPPFPPNELEGEINGMSGPAKENPFSYCSFSCAERRIKGDKAARGGIGVFWEVVIETCSWDRLVSDDGHLSPWMCTS